MKKFETLLRIIDQKDVEINTLKLKISSVKLTNATVNDMTWGGKKFEELTLDELREFCKALFEIEKYIDPKIKTILKF